MIVGIINNGKEIRGQCRIDKAINSFNQVITVFCEEKPATTEDSIIYTCDNCKQENTIHKRNFFRYKKHIECLCGKCQFEKKSLIKYGTLSPNQSQKVINKQHSKESRIKTSEASKKLWLREDYRNRMSKIGVRISKFQLDVYESLDKNIWKMEYAIPNAAYTVDICNPVTKEIIECYGDYWHCNPKLYEESFYHKRAHKTAKAIWTENVSRINDLEKLGYKVKIIWESDWKKRPR